MNEQAVPTASDPSLRTATEIVSLVLAPVAVVTGLLYYFGWVRTASFFNYFGIDQRLLGYSTNDYLLRSAGVAFRPFAVLLLVFGVLLAISYWMDQTLRSLSQARPVYFRIIGAGSTLIIAASLATLFGLLPSRLALPAAAGLVVATLLCSRWASIWWPVPFGMPHIIFYRRFLVLGAVVLGAFWACAVYAQNTGGELANSWANDLESRPGIIIYAEEDLRLDNAGVSMEALPDDSRFRFRYTGLRLLIYSNDRWFLISEQWQANDEASAVLISDTDDVRVEVTSGEP